MKIKRLEIKNFLGVKELNWSPDSGINKLEGKKAQGKTSILEAIEKLFTNINRRSEVIRHGEDEATLYVETDTGLEIDRRIRSEKADYLKVKGDGAASTETFLRHFVNGNIFRPLDFVNMSIKEQTAIILNMIEVNWSIEDIIQWFGEEPDNINFDKHILQVLKDIEVKYYKEREEINRQITVLKVQVDEIKKTLPGNYNGEDWKNLNIKDYYSKITVAEQINRYIEQAKALQEGIENKISAINADAESEKSKVELKYKEEEQDLKDLISLSEKKIEDSRNKINSAEERKEKERDRLAFELEKKEEEIRKELTQRLNDAQKEFKDQLDNFCARVDEENNEARDLIELQKQKIEVNNSKIVGLSEKKELELKGIDEAVAQKIETEKARVGNAAKYLDEHEVIDIAPLQEKADKVADMQSYLRDWDRMCDIMNGSLREKQEISDSLTDKIKMARQKPSDLLKTHELPIEGISVDEKGNIRINGTLLDGLSDGEKLEVAFKVALQRMGELRVMCLDGFEKLNPSEQEKVLGICEANDVQAFVTITSEKELEVN